MQLPIAGVIDLAYMDVRFRASSMDTTRDSLRLAAVVPSE